jgi:hypothetical protein
MSNQHLHNKIGNVIGECKRQLFNRLKAGADIETALAQFFCELNLRLDRIVANPDSQRSQ